LIFVLLVVFPKFAELFTSIGDQLPATTKVLMAISGFLLDHWIGVCVALTIAVVGAISWLKSAAGRAVMDRAKLTLPVLRSVWQRVYIVLWLRVLGLSVEHGVSLVEGVRTSRGVVNNALVQDFLSDLSTTIEQGGRLSVGVADTVWIPKLAKQMLATAEESGSLAPVMLRLSDYYNRELERALDRFSKMVEPIMLVFMGAMVGLLVSAMILPIFKLSSAVS